jgi:hypothetical protein
MVGELCVIRAVFRSLRQNKSGQKNFNHTISIDAGGGKIYNIRVSLKPSLLGS